MEALISLPQGQRTSENVSTVQGSILNTVQCVEYTNIKVVSELPLLTSCFTDLLGGFPREMEGLVNVTLMDLLNQGEKRWPSDKGHAKNQLSAVDSYEVLLHTHILIRCWESYWEQDR